MAKDKGQEGLPVNFGKFLAHTDKVVRDRGFKRLKRWLVKHPELERLEYMKVWKGLYFAVWMADKRPVQQVVGSSGLRSAPFPALLQHFPDLPQRSLALPQHCRDPLAELRRLYYFAREVMRKNHEEQLDCPLPPPADLAVTWLLKLVLFRTLVYDERNVLSWPEAQQSMQRVMRDMGGEPPQQLGFHSLVRYPRLRMLDAYFPSLHYAGALMRGPGSLGSAAPTPPNSSRSQGQTVRGHPVVGQALIPAFFINVEELAVNIALLLNDVPQERRTLWIDTFWETMKVSWEKLDVHRVLRIFPR
ncbi:Ribosomal RNA-processing protein 1-like [Symbiodinium microadriaticum]|uniref:Ribosomal RNA-processing protein 1-like n=1 Tax=Symbiodinium microadriaticum TaxID=2951 RepID=A0A1Q9DJ79_SYMMI|nr:Ribosomal RNA-processing protein 1-like [Symbiodinium microadriaticum]